jgi:hypothetical protein
MSKAVYSLNVQNEGLNILKFPVGRTFNSHSNKCFRWSDLPIALEAANEKAYI